MRTPKTSTRSDLARIVVLDGESRHRFDTLHHSLQQEFLPQTATERLLIAKMAVAYWRQMRIWSLEKSTISQDITHDEVTDSLFRDALTFEDHSRFCSFMTHYEASCDRQFSRALQRLLELRASRAASQNIFLDSDQEK